MFVVQIANPDGVSFLSAHRDLDQATESLHNWIEGQGDEHWAWIVETPLFVAHMGDMGLVYNDGQGE